MNKNVFQCMIAWCMVFIITIGLYGNVAQAASQGYMFDYKNVSVTMNGKAESIIDLCGTPITMKKKKSCAFKGYDRTYTYDNFVLKTYSKTKSGIEYVSGISFRNTTTATKEGIKIGSTKNDMIKEYGKKKGKFGVYIYTKGKSKLSFEVDSSDVIIKIEYVAK